MRLLASAATDGGKHPDYERALAGSPAPLAALHGQANELLPGGTDAYEQRIAALRGYPVVVNVWASWCGPCRFEFPILQKLSARYGKRVAFLGVDSQDSDDAADDLPRARHRSPTPATPTPTKRSSTRSAARSACPTPPSTTAPASSSTSSRAPTPTTPNCEADVRRYALKGG